MSENSNEPSPKLDVSARNIPIPFGIIVASVLGGMGLSPILTQQAPEVSAAEYCSKADLDLVRANLQAHKDIAAVEVRQIKDEIKRLTYELEKLDG